GRSVHQRSSTSQDSRTLSTMRSSTTSGWPSSPALTATRRGTASRRGPVIEVAPPPRAEAASPRGNRGARSPRALADRRSLVYASCLERRQHRAALGEAGSWINREDVQGGIGAGRRASLT